MRQLPGAKASPASTASACHCIQCTYAITAQREGCTTHAPWALWALCVPYGKEWRTGRQHGGKEWRTGPRVTLFKASGRAADAPLLLCTTAYNLLYF